MTDPTNSRPSAYDPADTSAVRIDQRLAVMIERLRDVDAHLVQVLDEVRAARQREARPASRPRWSSWDVIKVTGWVAALLILVRLAWTAIS